MYGHVKHHRINSWPYWMRRLRFRQRMVSGCWLARVRQPCQKCKRHAFHHLQRAGRFYSETWSATCFQPRTTAGWLVLWGNASCASWFWQFNVDQVASILDGGVLVEGFLLGAQVKPVSPTKPGYCHDDGGNRY